VTTHPHPEVGSTQVLAPPWRFDGARLPVRSAPPRLGEGTDDVLQTLLGLSSEQLSRLKADGVI
jgi:crotonobetainyl-CoA:carnitine CoA-transferase CaiB-like acyl-CoA transferase